MTIKPDLLTMLDGTPVTAAGQWPARREELLRVLAREQYGCMPPAPPSVHGEVLSTDDHCCAGHARLEEIRLSFDTPGGVFAFPMRFVRPAAPGAYPTFIYLSFSPELYHMHCPVEEIIDHGYALAVIHYQDVTSDDADMKSGLAGCYPREDSTAWGKLAMWGWAANRAADYLLTRPEADAANLGVIGHSRLGKAALICAAWDERIRFAFANDSGCGGAALEQCAGSDAETYARMYVKFPYWGCENRAAHPEAPVTHDQHFLLAAIAPRFVAVGSASRDAWANPRGEQLGCIAASPVWTLHGLPGYQGPEEPLKAGDAYPEGRIGYHLRDGVHFLSRNDWLRYMAFADGHRA